MYYHSLESPYGPLHVAFDEDAYFYALTFGELDTLHTFFPSTCLHPRALRTDLLTSLYAGEPLPIKPRGSPFKQKVWAVLQTIPKGQTVSYEELAVRTFGHKRYTRAAASAVAQNPLAWIIPCHRVVPKTGGIGQYMWGSHIKGMLLRDEQQANS
jgi:O-6-methylguanine DNA methyltransferase